MNYVFVIMNKGEVYESKFFYKLAEARNYIKFRHPKKRWKEPVENQFVCCYTGMKMTVVELTDNKSIESKLRESYLENNFSSE